jgi:hypothetical protein
MIVPYQILLKRRPRVSSLGTCIFTCTKPLFPAISLQQVRKRLAEHDAQSDKAYVLHNEVSASQMIIMGMDFEEQQCVECHLYSFICLLRM